MSKARVFIERKNELGEGALWHPARQSFFHFAITENLLFEHNVQGVILNEWDFGLNVSAAGIVSDTELLVASEKALFVLDLTDGNQRHICDLEADNSVTRSNDGRADRHGGFWIGTMGKQAENGAGAIYRYYKGELRVLVPAVTIPNSICFSPDGTLAYWTDTDVNRIMQVPLDADGWPAGTPSIFADHSGDEFGCDGSIVDADGYVWNARWGVGQIVRYSPAGAVERTINIPAPNCTCPALGGADGKMLFITTAYQGIVDKERKVDGVSGCTFAIDTDVQGLEEATVQID
ncbi:MAG: SMP-30/gluconolactonase/LRE family protein [Pseudomonadota bacterium]